MRNLHLTVSLSLLFACYQPAFADETSSSREAASTSANSAPDPAAPSPVQLQGQTVKVDVTLNEIRDALLSIHRVRKVTSNLYDEVTRQQMTMTYNPNVIGTTVIMVPRPTFSGQFLPPRKKWVDEFIAEIGPIINLFKEDVDAALESNRRTEVSDAARKSLGPIRTESFSLVKGSYDAYRELEVLTVSSAYDNNAIATQVKALDSQMKRLDRVLKDGLRILQKEAKAKKKMA